MIIKRAGRPSEPFSKDKLKRSISTACLSVKTPAGQTQQIADSVADSVEIWRANKPAVTSADIRRKAAVFLAGHSPEAAFIYEQDPDII